ncbi:MgtC/SapB family protein [Tsukamurella sp. 8F]|uniref:MgtC/SapB family protein n=1 Tax=unclassified Tsukamurella TaxID=2633480 RepID=UPI0023BA29D3|nr:MULTISPECIES: MgtC/SapB family protein [unclassified Tsukamurella]MDF0530031.1 MgtC/SapB family protein [Tsukamurella sp. 8J]MDF0587197.1 MgtC/SapB family protein [Tsukamurella sp. 8F]
MTTLAADWISAGQGWRQIEELVLAFCLSAVVGVEREVRGKSAGLRTQAIVGTTAALFMLVSKYGFADVLAPGAVVLDPSRVAAQVVSGIGFLGAGLIITRRGAIRGLTTAAAVWETAAIGMAAGAGLEVLAVVVTVLHFVAVLGFTPLGRFLGSRGTAERGFTVTYEDGRGVLRSLLAECSRRGWTVASLAVLDGHSKGGDPEVTVSLSLVGRGVAEAAGALSAVDGILRVDRGADED